MDCSLASGLKLPKRTVLLPRPTMLPGVLVLPPSAWRAGKVPMLAQRNSNAFHAADCFTSCLFEPLPSKRCLSGGQPAGKSLAGSCSAARHLSAAPSVSMLMSSPPRAFLRMCERAPCTSPSSLLPKRRPRADCAAASLALAPESFQPLWKVRLRGTIFRNAWCTVLEGSCFSSLVHSTKDACFNGCGLKTCCSSMSSSPIALFAEISPWSPSASLKSSPPRAASAGEAPRQRGRGRAGPAKPIPLEVAETASNARGIANARSRRRHRRGRRAQGLHRWAMAGGGTPQAAPSLNS
mmetsp:Transcript_5551/g.14773  ORF Transcript_5551/g.14773 Transcript_5551/m.14773 type:complete len:295 (+) Transcript_5551:532-1416(+)